MSKNVTSKNWNLIASGGRKYSDPNAVIVPPTITLTSSTSSSITLSLSGGNGATTWLLQYKDTNSSWPTTNVGTTLTPGNQSYAITGLSNNTQYNIRVKCINSYYNGFSTTLSASTQADTNAPVAPTLSAGSPSYSTLPFTIINQGSNATAWQVQYKLSSDSSWTNASTSISVGATSYTLSGLQATTLYNIRIHATNSYGYSDSASISMTTSSAPTVVTADATSDFTARTSIPSVVWYHNFSSESELTAFTDIGAYVTGTVNNYSDLAALQNVQINDTYFVRSQLNTYYWTGSSWVSIKTLNYITTDGISSGKSFESAYPASDMLGPNDYWEGYDSVSFFIHQANGGFPVTQILPAGSSTTKFSNGWSVHIDRVYQIASLGTTTNWDVIFGRTQTGGWKVGDQAVAVAVGTGDGKVFPAVYPNPKNVANGTWVRPFSPLSAGTNGKNVDDPAAGGTISVRTTWNPANAQDSSSNWYYGFYGKPEYQQMFSTWTDENKGKTTSGIWDGYDYWLQVRVKLVGDRHYVGTKQGQTVFNPDGKLIFIDSTRVGSQYGELIMQSIGNIGRFAPVGTSSTIGAPLKMYASKGSLWTSDLSVNKGAASTTYEPGSQWESTCRTLQSDGTVPTLNNPGACWYWETENWTTLLIHVIPGTNNGSSSQTPNNKYDAGIEVWAQKQNEKSYNRIYTAKTLPWTWDWAGGGLATAITTTGSISSITTTSSTGLYGIQSSGVLMIDYELFNYTYSGSGSTIQIIARGVNGTIPATHVAGSAVLLKHAEGAPPGFNAFSFLSYMNNQLAYTGWSQRFTDLIFSKQYIDVPAPVGATAPSWFKSLSEKTWTVVAGGTSYGSAFQNGATLSSRNPGLTGVSYTDQNGTTGSTGDQNGIIKDWTGAVANQEDKELLLVANGGHGDYWGNEVYALQLNQDVPAWVRLTDPTPASYCNGQAAYLGTAGTSPAIYADGRPRAMHTSCSQCFGDGKVWTMSQIAYASIGHTNNQIFSFNRRSLSGTFPIAHNGGTGPWTSIGNGSTVDIGVQHFGPSCYDRVNHKAWGFAGAQNTTKVYWSVDTINNQITSYTDTSSVNVNADFQSQWAVCLYDLGLIVVSDQNTSDLYILNTNNPSAGFTKKTVSGSNGRPTSAGNQVGAVYHRASSAILTYNYKYQTAGEIMKLKVPRNADGSYNSSGTWTWTTITKVGTTFPTSQYSDPANGTYSKFNIIENMGNGQACIVLTLGTGAGYTYVYKLPAGELF